MGLKETLLGLLTNRPSSGYTLHKTFFEPMRPALSQIYRALVDMSNDNLVEFTRVHSEKSPSKNIYSITEKGEEVLQSYLKRHVNVQPIREPTVQKIWYGDLINNGDVINSLKAFRDQRKREAEYYQQKARGMIDKRMGSGRNTLAQLYRDLVFDYVQKRSDCELKWAEDAIHQVLGAYGEYDAGNGGTRKYRKDKAPKTKKGQQQ